MLLQFNRSVDVLISVRAARITCNPTEKGVPATERFFLPACLISCLISPALSRDTTTGENPFLKKGESMVTAGAVRVQPT